MSLRKKANRDVSHNVKTIPLRSKHNLPGRVTDQEMTVSTPSSPGTQRVPLPAQTPQQETTGRRKYSANVSGSCLARIAVVSGKQSLRKLEDNEFLKLFMSSLSSHKLK